MLREELVVAAQDNVMASGDDALAVMANKEELRFIRGAIGRLPEKLRTIFTMSVLAGLSSAEISERLEIPAGTVRYQLSLARKQLAQNLQAFEKSNLGGGHVSQATAI